MNRLLREALAHAGIGCVEAEHAPPVLQVAGGGSAAYGPPAARGNALVPGGGGSALGHLRRSRAGGLLEERRGSGRARRHPVPGHPKDGLVLFLRART